MTTYQISGRVLDRQTQIGVSELRVEVWDKDSMLDDHIAVVKTGKQGEFQTLFESAVTRDWIFFDRKPDLYFKVFHDNSLLYSSESDVLWNAENPTVVTLAFDMPEALKPTAPLTAFASTVRPRIQRRTRLKPLNKTAQQTRSSSTMQDRRQQARQIRIDAAELASQREHPEHINNGEEFRYRDESNNPTHIANFTKGLPHDYKGMLVVESLEKPCTYVPGNSAYLQLIKGIDSGDERDFRDTPLGPPGSQGALNPEWKSVFACGAKARAWESQGAGLTFDLQGPDAQALTMPPAPTLDSDELVTEMAEVYHMALLRDVPFAQLSTDPGVDAAVKQLNETQWIKNPGNRLTAEESSRRRGPFTCQNVFRGITKGDDVGPYLSQFLLVGNTGLDRSEDISNGMISYGSIRIDQRVREAQCHEDFMTNWEAWLDVQNGADLRGRENYVKDASCNPSYRFMATPRDLATYVHYDALYEAYLNACLIMLGMGVSLDPGIPFRAEDVLDKQQGFAQFGGPHILSLVTEVATRALKAVRYQKFNVHRRARPEGLGGFVNRYLNNDKDNISGIAPLAKGLPSELMSAVASHNAKMNGATGAGGGYNSSYLLPMAFPEGSPMHPAYGAGHATVAGACVTILKAFFDHGYELDFAFQPSKDGSCLEPFPMKEKLTVEGELNKLASNISIGRNWAGVHYFTDYIESIRLGESIALGILEEQKLTYGENFSMTVPLFDGGVVRI